MKRKCPEDLSLHELRILLVTRRQASRKRRLDDFYRTRRVRPFVHDEEWVMGDGDSTISGLVRSTKPERTWMDFLLLGMEALAVVGLFGILFVGFSMLRSLNQSVVIALQQPTLEPTPLVRDVILPDGHTPPNAPGGASPNEAEIPPHLRPLVQSVPNLPFPTPASQQTIRIQIPAINVDAPVVQGDGWEQLKKGVAQHLGTANPGQTGNLVLSGHNDIYGEVFRDLDRLEPGDTVILFTNQRQYTYVITGTQMVEPTAVEVMAPTPGATITLISCHPYLVDIHRIVVSAVLQSS
jgi:sortase A